MGHTHRLNAVVNLLGESVAFRLILQVSINQTKIKKIPSPLQSTQKIPWACATTVIDKALLICSVSCGVYNLRAWNFDYFKSLKKKNFISFAFELTLFFCIFC